MNLETLLTQSNKLLQVQGLPGTWNYDAYMQGLYNGMELIIAIFEDRTPCYKETPEQWGSDINKKIKYDT